MLQGVSAQTVEIDSLQTDTTFQSFFPDDSLSEPFLPNLIRSAIIPGLGQAYQERPGKSVVFYGLAGSFIYNGVYNYCWYDKTGDNKYFTRFRKYAILYGQLYLFNIMDVVKTQLSGKDLVWTGEMFSDKPIKSPWGAVAKSAMLPGWGQFYNEEYIKGIISFLLVADFTRKAIINDIKYKRTRSAENRERRSVNTWYAGLAYALNMVDSYVDAYLYKFDETMELTISVIPIENTFGVQLLINF